MWGRGARVILRRALGVVGAVVMLGCLFRAAPPGPRPVCVT